MAVFKTGLTAGLVLYLGLACVFFAQESGSNQTGQHPKRLYRIEDDDGNTVFADKIPAELNQYRQERLNARGMVVEKKDKAKSSEQQIMETRLAALRQETQKLIARQKMHDEALLSTYHSENDIADALQVALEGFDTKEKLLESKLKNISRQLDNHIKVAAEYERSGKPLPASLVASIAASRASLVQIQQALQANKDKRQLTENEYRADIERFLFLTESHKKPGKEILVPSVKEANLLGLFYCDNDRQCNKAWHLARDFINQYSTTKPNIFNEKLIMNRPPATDSDISLSLSRISLTDNDYLLFLDILCHNSASGQALCASDQVRAIRSQFRPYMNDVLARARQQ